jgi:DNA-binding winged helix-turn-helix (wHTH) protein
MQARRLYEFGPFRLDPADRLLLRGIDPVPLTSKAFDTLLVLVENGGHLMEKEKLLNILWPETCVEEHNLAQQVFLLRKTLGEGPDGRSYIETVPKRGYRFSVPGDRGSGR